jgi:hypothetical protein
MNKIVGFIGMLSIALVIVAGINAFIGLYNLYGFFIAIFGLVGAPLHMFLPWYAIVEWYYLGVLSTHGFVSVSIWAFYVILAATALIANFIIKYKE